MPYCNMCGESWCFFPVVFFIGMMVIFAIIARRKFLIGGRKGFRLKWMQDFCAGRSASGRFESADDLLKKRYIRGEISKEEFNQMKKDIWDSK